MFAEYAALVFPGLPPGSRQWADLRATFLAGMVSAFTGISDRTTQEGVAFMQAALDMGRTAGPEVAVSRQPRG